MTRHRRLLVAPATALVAGASRTLRRARTALAVTAVTYTLLIGLVLTAAAVTDARWDPRGSAVLLVLAMWIPQTVLTAIRHSHRSRRP